MIRYDLRIDRARDSKTGRFVSFRKAHSSSIFRKEYEPVMLKKKIKELKKGIIEREKLIEQMKERKVEWKKVEEVLLEYKESVINMYIELHDKLSKKEYNKLIKKIEKKDHDSNKKRRVLHDAFMELESK